MADPEPISDNKIVVSESLEVNLADGSLSRVTREPIPNPEEVLRQLIVAPTIPLPLSDELSYILSTGNASGVGIVALKTIRLNAQWFSSTDTDGNVFMSPIIEPTSASRSRGSADIPLGSQSVEWIPNLSEMVPFFVSTYVLADTRPTSLGTCFLIFVDRETTEFYTPPLPNVYGDGRLCTGPLGSVAPSILGSVFKTLEQWSANVWNHDLLADWKYPYLRKEFRVDPITLQMVGQSSMWHRRLPKTGRVPGDTGEMQGEVVNEIKRIIEAL